MSTLDYLVLIATTLGIAGYGVWRTRGRQTFENYVRGEERVSWATIGLAVMATQASAITFLSTPGQGFESGMGFVQNYFGMPFALIVVSAVFLPLYRRLRVMTAYEYLGHRFDQKTRLLGAGPVRTFRQVHLPLLHRSALAAALLVFVDTMKELPATLVLRPFGSDTLAVVAWNLARDERLAEAALPSLAIVAVGLLPVVLLARAIRG